MTQEQKDLLLKDLCGRLPYGVKVESIFINPDTKEYKSCGIEVFDATSLLMIRDGIGEFKPYLFPFESMSEKQHKELHDKLIELELLALEDKISRIEAVKFEIDYYLKNHFDYKGLIPIGLAKDATNLNIYISYDART